MSDNEMSALADDATAVSPSDQLRKEQAHNQMNGKTQKSISVSKPIPYTFDLGHLLLNDANPVEPGGSADTILATGRDCAQALINQLLGTCTLDSTKDGVFVNLPQGTTSLPREKSIPKEKEPTKWETFAKKRGIKNKKRDGNLVFDEASGEWVKKWGYKGVNKAAETSWAVEVDMAKEQRLGEAGNSRNERRAERKERVRRQERRQRANEQRSKTKS